MKAFEKLQKTRFFTTDLLAKDCRIKKSTNKEVCANVLLKIIKNQKNYCKNRKNMLNLNKGTTKKLKRRKLTMKKLLKAIGIILLIPIILCVGLFAFFVIDTIVPQKFNYVVNSDNVTCTVTGAKNMTSYSINIPEKIDGYTVTGIAPEAFKKHKAWTLFLPETIEYIGEGAFAHCEELSGISGLEKCTNLKEIQPHTFEACYDLNMITLPEGLEKIGENAFYKCYKGLTNINIPSTVTTIEFGAFAACQELTKITIPASVELIGITSFEGCISLEAIEVEAENANYCSVDGVLYTKGMKVLCVYPSSKLGKEYTIPEGVETIATAAFAYPRCLNTLNIPDSVEVIEQNAFIDIYTLSYLQRINYNGTIRMWENINIHPDWCVNYYPSFTVYCTNGQISKKGTITYN